VNSAAQAMMLSQIGSAPDATPMQIGQLDPKVWQHIWSAEAAMLNGMKDGRSFLLACLAFASALTFVALGRLVRPAGLPREGMRKLLVGSALVAAFLRVIEGAQTAVISKKVGSILGAAMNQVPEYQTPGAHIDFVHFASQGLLAATMGWTVLVAGVFLVLSQHFRSPSIRELVEKTDASLE
jgi:hypothetical protein